MNSLTPQCCVSNEAYELCPSYPSQIIAPRATHDEMLRGSAAFRSKVG